MAPHPQRLTITRRAWLLARPLITAHGVETTVDVIVAEISDGDSRGRGEGVPLRRYGETIDSVVTAVEAMKGAIFSGLNRDTLQSALPPGAARNALDCAFWDIDAERAYRSVAELGGLGAVMPVVTAFTLAFDTPDKMADLAAVNRTRPLVKLELGGDGDLERVRAVRQAAPAARLIVDANESWNEAQLSELMPTLIDARVQLIEQPLPADADDALARLELPIPLCADESCRTLADLDRLAGKYEAINIKLDKVGGLTEALALAAEAKRRGLRIMVGGVIGTSLGIAPALVVAQQADIVDLDGPLRLASDRPAGLRYDGSTIQISGAGPANVGPSASELVGRHVSFAPMAVVRSNGDAPRLRTCYYCDRTCCIKIGRRRRPPVRTSVSEIEAGDTRGFFASSTNSGPRVRGYNISRS
jgi:L-alanine-DL-glutamate epimerase-like enolase superfamily enzyme